jgi:hypothetical protein
MIEIPPTYDIFAVLKDTNVRDFFKTSYNPDFKNMYAEGMSPNYFRDGAVGGNLQSPNFVTGSAGWIIKANGDVEFNNGTFRGALAAATGTIGGFTIGATTLVGGSVTLNSSGIIKVAQSSIANTFIQLDQLGINFLLGSTINGLIYLTVASTPFSTGQMSFQIGDSVGSGLIMHLACTASNTGALLPGTGDTLNLGDATDYWNDINYKTLTDRGCLGWFDVGVELCDGRIVTDVEAIKSIKREPSKMTVYGVPMLDYSSMPKAVYKPAPIATKDVCWPNSDKIRFKKGEKMGSDGAETTALISIMLGSIKELALRVEALEADNKVLKAEVEKLKNNK